MHGKLPISLSQSRILAALGLVFVGAGLSGCEFQLGLSPDDVRPLLGKSVSNAAPRASDPLPPSFPQTPPQTTHPASQFPEKQKGKGKGVPEKTSISLPPVQQKLPSDPGHDHDHDHGHPPVSTDPSTGGDDGSIQVGEPCAHDSALCLGLRYVVYRSPEDQNPIEASSDVERNLDDINRIWSDCGIGFQVERFNAIAPEEHELRYQTANYDELNAIRREFKDDHRLLVVLTGPWDRRGSLGGTHANAWTNMPGEGIYGSILEGPMRRTPNMIAHELGHYLGLGHVHDGASLMNPLISTVSRRLDRSQCSEARRTAQSEWAAMLRHSN